MWVTLFCRKMMTHNSVKKVNSSTLVPGLIWGTEVIKSQAPNQSDDDDVGVDGGDGVMVLYDMAKALEMAPSCG